MVDVSIIMPIYNVEKYLEKAIKSVLNQTYKNIELILINDGSPDNSDKICRFYEKIDKRVSVINQKNAGAGYARNAGLDKACGEYIYFADPDDYLELNLIEENLNLAQSSGADLVVFGFYEEFLNNNGDFTNTVKSPVLKETTSTTQFRNGFREFYRFTPYALWNKLYRRDYVKNSANRFLNQKIGEDALFNQAVYRNLGKVVFNEKAYYHYVYREGSAVNHYTKNRFEQEYKVAQQFDALMDMWGKESEYIDLISREYWNSIYLELKNLTSIECPLNQNEKVEHLKEIMENSGLKQAVKTLSIENEQNKFVEALIRLVRKENYSLALRLMNFRITIGEKNRSMVLFLKKLFHKKEPKELN